MDDDKEGFKGFKDLHVPQFHHGLYSENWHDHIAARDAERVAESRRMIQYYQRQQAEREARENRARAARYDHREAVANANAWLQSLLNAEQHQADLERGMSSEATAHREHVARIRAEYLKHKAEADRLAAIVAQAPGYP